MAVPQLLTWAQGLMKMPKYSERIPEAVRNNISRLGYYIQSDAFDPTAVTPFLNAMLAKIGKQMITGYQWDNNVFDRFYKGDIPVGGYIEEDFIGVQAGEAYPATLTDGTSVDPFVIKKPSTTVTYFAVNFGMQYWTTIADEQLSTAVLSNETFSNFIGEAIGVLAKSYHLDKYLAVREMFGAGDIYGQTVATTITSSGDSFSQTEAIEIVKVLKSYIKATRKPSTAYNKAAVLNAMSASDQVLIINTVIYEMLKDALRTVYHDEIDFDCEIMEVDGFGETGATAGQYSALVSANAVKLYDKQSERTNNIFNPRGEYWNHFLKGWGWIGYSNTAPAIKFTLATA